ncbi:26S proteasome regulatory subunit 7, partial [Dissostichus eleginoides]
PTYLYPRMVLTKFYPDSKIGSSPLPPRRGYLQIERRPDSSVKQRLGCSEGQLELASQMVSLFLSH